MGIPLTVDTDWKAYTQCDDDICGGCEFEASDPDIINTPCCSNGCCKHCATIGGDAPYLVPKAIACGRNRMRGKDIEDLLLKLTEMPGKGPHSALCVRSRGITNVQYVNVDCEKYELEMKVDIPIEIVIKDCCGFIYTIKSTIEEQSIKIPLGFTVQHLAEGGSFLYFKVKVRMCEQMENVSTGSTFNLNILLEACVVRLVPYGIVGDPTSRFGPYFCS
jgi:hypothetical protein